MKPPRILVADDDTAMVALVRDMLLPTGADVISVSTGVDVLDVLINQGEVSLVVLDVHMPPPSGLRVVALARRSGYRGPFLLITAFPDTVLEEWSAHMPGTSVLAKPFEQDQLLQRIGDLGGLRPPDGRKPWGKVAP